MSHGSTDGKIYTDHLEKNGKPAKSSNDTYTAWSNFESYTTEEVFQSIRENKKLEKALKIIIFQVKRRAKYYCSKWKKIIAQPNRI
jgi:hypothetical protein